MEEGETKNGKKNNSMDFLNDWQATRKRGRGSEKETLREKKSLLMAAQNNAIRTNYVQARIDKTQQNSRCRLRSITQ